MKEILASILLLLSAVGFSQSVETPNEIKIKTAKDLANKFFKKNRIMGMAISVSQKGELIWSQGFGYSNRKLKIKVKPDTTIFRIASISKSITAVALARLANDKLIDLDSSIYKYVPDYPRQPYDFTIRQLGGNLAGIRHYKDNVEYTLNKKMSITEGLDLFKNDALLFEPGSQFNYSSLGYVLLSEVMQKATQTSFGILVADSIFKPLQMSHSMMEDADLEVPNLTQFYNSSKWRRPVVAKSVSNEYKVAGGGFLSTSEDIVKFGNELIFPKFLTEKSIAEITTSQSLITGERTGYGIGFSSEKTKNGTPKYYHTGGGVGASSILLIYPREEIVITVLTNLTGVSMTDFGSELENVFVN